MTDRAAPTRSPVAIAFSGLRPLHTAAGEPQVVVYDCDLLVNDKVATKDWTEKKDFRRLQLCYFSGHLIGPATA